MYLVLRTPYSGSPPVLKRGILDDDGIRWNIKQHLAESSVAYDLAPHAIEHPLHIKLFPISAFLIFIEASDFLLGHKAVGFISKKLLQICMAVGIFTEHSCYVSALRIIECVPLHLKRKAAHHIANGKCMTFNRICATAKGITINR